MYASEKYSKTNEKIIGISASIVSPLSLLFALFASEDNLLTSEQLVVFGLHVALGAVEPLFAASGANRYLSVQNMFAHPVLNSNLIILM